MAGRGNDFYEIASFVGSIASFAGLLVTLFQVIRARSASEAAREAAEEARSDIIDFVTAAEVSQANQLIGLIQNNLYDEKYEAAGVRLRNLKDILVQFRNHRKLDEIGGADVINDLVKKIGAERISIQKQARDPTREYDVDPLVDRLEDASSALSEFESKLKYRKP